MPKTSVMRMASAQSVSMPLQYLLRQARKGAEALYSETQDKRRLGSIALHHAFAEALFSNVQIRERRDLHCEAGPPLGDGGERTKKRITPHSPQHLKRVARSFIKILAPEITRTRTGLRNCIHLARKIVVDNWEPTLS